MEVWSERLSGRIDQHAQHWTQVTRPSNNGAKKVAPAQATVGSNAAIKEHVSATRVAFKDKAKMASDPDMAMAMEKLAALWGDFE